MLSVFLSSSGRLHMRRPRASEHRVHFRRAATCAASCCHTRLSQHVGEAHVWAEGRVHLHPGGHGVKLTVVMELIQKFLKRFLHKNEIQTNPFAYETLRFSLFLLHLKGLSVLPLSSSFSKKGLLFLLLFLLLQGPYVLLETNEGILFIHICRHTTAQSAEDLWPFHKSLLTSTSFYSTVQTTKCEF